MVHKPPSVKKKLFSRLEGWLDWFIPEALHKNPISLFRSRVLVTGAFLLGSLTIALLAQFFFVIGKLPPGVVPAVVLAVIFLLVPWLIRWTNSYKLAGLVLSMAFLLGLPAIGYKVPVFPSPVYFLFPIVPLLAVYFVNTPMGLFSALLLSVATYGLYLHKGKAVVGYPPKLIFNFSVYLIIAIWIVVLFSWLYERSRIWSMTMLEKTMQDLRKANQAKDDFLARASHELRTPLNAIIGYTEMIEEEAEDEGWEDVAKDAGRVLQSGQHLLQLINDLLDLTHFEAGELEVKSEEITLDSFTKQLYQRIEPLTLQNKNELHLLNEASISSFFADATRLQQVLYNVMANACKFTEKGSISLRISEDQQVSPPQLSFEVTDTGKGIPKELQEHIFELFSQVDTSKTRKNDGLGLGLPLSRHLCRLMGGDLTVQSKPGRGATFIVRLPMGQGGTPLEA